MHTYTTRWTRYTYGRRIWYRSDLLTKPLPREDWWRLRGPLLGHSLIILNDSIHEGDDKIAIDDMEVI